MDKFDMLAREAADLGVEIGWTLDLPEYIHAFYEDDERLIIVNLDCTDAQALSAIAHEVGHAEFGDRCSTEAVERRADEWGAALLVSSAEYAAAEELVGPHAGALARELGVTRDIVLAWRSWWHRAGHMQEVA